MNLSALLDGPLRPVSRDLIRAFGKTVVLRHLDRVQDQVSGKVTTEVIDQVVKGAVLDSGDSFMQGSPNIEPGDVEVWVADLDVDREPDAGDLLFLGPDTTAREYKIKAVGVIWTGEKKGIFRLLAGR